MTETSVTSPISVSFEIIPEKTALAWTPTHQRYIHFSVTRDGLPLNPFSIQTIALNGNTFKKLVFIPPTMFLESFKKPELDRHMYGKAWQKWQEQSFMSKWLSGREPEKKRRLVIPGFGLHVLPDFGFDKDYLEAFEALAKKIIDSSRIMRKRESLDQDTEVPEPHVICELIKHPLSLHGEMQTRRLAADIVFRIEGISCLPDHRDKPVVDSSVENLILSFGGNRRPMIQIDKTGKVFLHFNRLGSLLRDQYQSAIPSSLVEKVLDRFSVKELETAFKALSEKLAHWRPLTNGNSGLGHSSQWEL